MANIHLRVRQLLEFHRALFLVLFTSYLHWWFNWFIWLFAVQFRIISRWYFFIFYRSQYKRGNFRFNLNNNSIEITQWVFQLKKSSNSDISKQAHKVVFSGKRNILSHLSFNDIPVTQTCSQKHLEKILDNKLSFE